VAKFALCLLHMGMFFGIVSRISDYRISEITYITFQAIFEGSV